MLCALNTISPRPSRESFASPITAAMSLSRSPITLQTSLPSPSDILEYFRDKQDIIESGDWDALTLNFIDKWEAVNNTAQALTKHGLSFIAAQHLHHR